jgi:excinuclease UvrABC nuclease subunit
MAAGQLWLFDPPKPLVERFGSEFFRGLPERPGVYLMCGVGEGVLYVGKARNLLKRLSAYRVANPERMSRRMIRLLHQTRRI